MNFLASTISNLLFFVLLYPALVYFFYFLIQTLNFLSFNLKREDFEANIDRLTKDIKIFMDKYSLEDIPPSGYLLRELSAQKLSGYKNVSANFIDYCIIKKIIRLDIAFFLFDKCGEMLNITINREDLNPKNTTRKKADDQTTPSSAETAIIIANSKLSLWLKNKKPAAKCINVFHNRFYIIITAHVLLFFSLLVMHLLISYLVSHGHPIIVTWVISLLFFLYAWCYYKLASAVCLLVLLHRLELDI